MSAFLRSIWAFSFALACTPALAQDSVLPPDRAFDPDFSEAPHVWGRGLKDPGPPSGMVFDPAFPTVPYVGGRGLLTVEGPTGMFLNPTSGTAPAGKFDPQACVLFFDVNGDHATGYGLLLTYGVTDWFEIGTYGLLVDGLNPAVTGEETLLAGQINARVRLLRDEGGLPEVSVGGMIQEGHDPLRRHTLYIAASKGFDFGTHGLFQGARVHAGFRQFWQDPDVHEEEEGSIFYIGAELKLPANWYLVGEVSTKDDVYEHTPYAVGLQYRGSVGGLLSGLTIAVMQPGNSDDPAFYFGIGVTF
jgi:hypothetical protein